MSARTEVFENKEGGKKFPLGQIVPNIDERVRRLENIPNVSVVVVTKPEIAGSLFLPVIGGTTTITVSSKSLLVGGKISKFTYEFNGAEAVEIPAVDGSASFDLSTPKGAEVGQTFDLFVRAYDNYGSYNGASEIVQVIEVKVATPTISGKTEDVIKNEATFTGSSFEMVGASGSHDKSDWILTSGSSDEEIWSSKDDTTNKTTSPAALRNALEYGQDYVIKLRYHDSVTGLWSDYGKLSFNTANISIATPRITGNTTNVPINGASFTGSPFSIAGASGNHDKSDWVLTPYNTPQSEVWSSKNDTTNKTNSPSSLNNKVLQGGTQYRLKLRYHDSVNDLWSDWGEIAFTTSTVSVDTPTINGQGGEVTPDIIKTWRGTAFNVTGATGTHDKSDWVLFKYDNLDSEIWSSKNDTTNKITPPESIGEAISESGHYLLKLRYHDAASDSWSDWGEKEFYTADSFRKHWELAVATKGVHFITGTTGKQTVFNAEDGYYTEDNDREMTKLDVYVNGSYQRTLQFFCITPQVYFIANDGDEILITPHYDEDSNSWGWFPQVTFDHSYYKDISILKKILEPFPSAWFSGVGGQPYAITIVDQQYLTELPEHLYDNYGATSSNKGDNTAGSPPSGPIANCKALTKVPVDIFARFTGKNDYPTGSNIGAAFKDCSSLAVDIRYTFTNLAYLSHNKITEWALNTKGTPTVRVPLGSDLATKFRELGRINVIEE